MEESTESRDTFLECMRPMRAKMRAKAEQGHMANYSRRSS